VGDDFDLCGALRRIRRLADLSQRELAAAAALSPSAVAHAEAGTRDLPVSSFARAAAVAGLRLALVDGDGHHVGAMAGHTVRDRGGRRFPAHLDTHHSDDRWWRYEHRYDRPRPWFTVDRDRDGRDRLRQRAGTPEDHHEHRPGDSPQERKAQRVREARHRADEERRRRIEAGEFPARDDFVCSCPPRCDELDDGSGKPVHAEACPCNCDLG
jgi:transcriptional regulator with XRE-family HTH domain